MLNAFTLLCEHHHRPSPQPFHLAERTPYSRPSSCWQPFCCFLPLPLTLTTLSTSQEWNRTVTFPLGPAQCPQVHRVVACVRMSFLLGQNFIAWIDHICLIHSSVSRYFGRFNLLAVVRNAPMNTSAQKWSFLNWVDSELVFYSEKDHCFFSI